MTPTSFRFTVTVPRDARLAEVLRELAAHAADYAEIDKAVGEGFVDRVGALAHRRLAAGGAATCHVEYGCEQSILFFTLDGETIQSH